MKNYILLIQNILEMQITKYDNEMKKKIEGQK